MEFWGVEVKAGESFKVTPELFKLIHVSQAAIGEVKDPKQAKNVPLRVTVGENSYVIGTLSAEDRPQLMFDLVFEREFELSHGWKNGSVFFIGYMADDPCTDEIDSEDEDSEDEEEDEENVLDASVNGQVEEKKVNVKKAAPAKPAEKSKVVAVEPKKEAESDDDDSEDDSDDEEDDDSSDVPVGMDSDGPEGMDFSDDSDDEDDSEEEVSEEETPKKFEKKRPATVTKGAAPGSAKKAKQATPDKTGGKKGPATPASAKQNGKPSANGNNKKKAQSPKSGGQFSGKSANKNFGSQQKGGFKGKHGKK